MKLPAHVDSAIKCGIKPKVRAWRRLQTKNLTRAERVMTFIEEYLRVPEGSKVGQKIRLDIFQQAFIYAIYDNPHITYKAYLSISRKNGKTALIAGLALTHIIGPEARLNSQLISGAMSRKQAAIVFHQAEKMVNLNPDLKGLVTTVSSGKRITGIKKNVEYEAISAEGTTAHGLSPIVAILDEVGQIKGPTSAFVEAITTSQGAHDLPLLIAISTSAPSDADLFSQWCDDAEVSQDPHTVCHVYKADEDCDLLDKKQWKKANPALGIFRSKRDLEEQLKQASRIPSMEASARNLLLNNRISLESLWLAPAVWKENGDLPDWDKFKQYGVRIGLDLSKKNDLTVALISTEDENGIIHVYPFAFTPLSGIGERSRRDRVPYDMWAKNGIIHGVPGETIDYEWVCQFLKKNVEDNGMEVHSIEFDRWRIEELQAAAERTGFAAGAEWNKVGQGYMSISPRIEAMETALLQRKIKHGKHPVLNLGASSAIVVQDPAGNRKIDKPKSSQKIDAIVAMIMSIYPWITKCETEGVTKGDISWWVG